MSSSIALLTGLLVFSLSLAAQGTSVAPSATIEYVSDDDIIIIRNGRRLNVEDPFGLELFNGDQVQTGRGVAMEIRLIGNKALVKITENTTFVLESQTSDQSGLRLVYGRLRAKVEQLTGTESFSVQSSGAVAGVRGTDFGYDYVAVQSSATPAARIYCFEGELEVTALVRTPATMSENLEPVVKRFILESGTMVQLLSANDADQTEKVLIEPQVREFWKNNDFEDKAGVPEIVATLQPESSAGEVLAVQENEPVMEQLLTLEPIVIISSSQSDKLPQPVIEYVPQIVEVRDEVELHRLRNIINLRSGGVLAGSMLIATGIGMNVYAIYQDSLGNADFASKFSLYGTIIAGSALPFLLVTLLVNK